MNKLKCMPFSFQLFLFFLISVNTFIIPLLIIQNIMTENILIKVLTVVSIIVLAIFYYLYYLFILNSSLEQEKKPKTKVLVVLLVSALLHLLYSGFVALSLLPIASIDINSFFPTKDNSYFTKNTIIPYSICIALISTAIFFIFSLIPALLFKKKKNKTAIIFTAIIMLLFVVSILISLNSFNNNSNIADITNQALIASKTPDNYSALGGSIPYISKDKLYIADPVKECINIYSSSNGKLVKTISIPFNESQHPVTLRLNPIAESIPIFNTTKYVMFSSLSSLYLSEILSILYVSDNTIFIKTSSLDFNNKKINHNFFALDTLTGKLMSISTPLSTNMEQINFAKAFFTSDYTSIFGYEPSDNFIYFVKETSSNSMNIMRKRISSGAPETIYSSSCLKDMPENNNKWTIGHMPYNARVYYDNHKIYIWEYKFEIASLTNYKPNFKNFSIRLTTLDSNGNVMKQKQIDLHNEKNPLNISDISKQNSLAKLFAKQVPQSNYADNNFLYTYDFEKVLKIDPDTIKCSETALDINFLNAISFSKLLNFRNKLQIDDDNNIYLFTDDKIKSNTHCVHKFSQNGKKLWSIKN